MTEPATQRHEHEPGCGMWCLIITAVLILGIYLADIAKAINNLANAIAGGTP